MRHLAVRLALAAALLAPYSVSAAPQQAEAPPSRIEQLAAASSAMTGPLAVGVEHDVYCTGWLGDVNERFTGSIWSAEKIDNQRGFIQGDILYLDIGTSSGVAPGQEYWICRPDRIVYKWGSVLDEAGRIYLTPGRLRVLCAQDTGAIAEVVLSCSDINPGDLLLPFEPIPIPLVRRTAPVTSCDPGSDKPMGRIVATNGDVTPIAEDSVVFLDLGERDGLTPGDFLTIYRTRQGTSGAMRTILGEVAVLTSRSRSSLGKVTLMRDTMYVGDEVQLK